MKSKYVLLVEDNRDDETLTLRALKRSRIDAEVVVVRDGVEALDFLHQRGQYKDRDQKRMPEMVLLDLKLPKVDGLEVLRQLRDYPPTRFLPVVVFTSSTEDRDVVNSYELGANSFISKPVNFDEFIDAASLLGRYWLKLNRPLPV